MPGENKKDEMAKGTAAQRNYVVRLDMKDSPKAGTQGQIYIQFGNNDKKTEYRLLTQGAMPGTRTILIVSAEDIGKLDWLKLLENLSRAGRGITAASAPQTARRSRRSGGTSRRMATSARRADVLSDAVEVPEMSSN